MAANSQTTDTLFRMNFRGVLGQCKSFEYNSPSASNKDETRACAGNNSVVFPGNSVTYLDTGDTTRITATGYGTQQSWYSGTFIITVIGLADGLARELHLYINEMWPRQRGGSSSSVNVDLKDVPIVWNSDSSASLALDSSMLAKSLVAAKRSYHWDAGTMGWISGNSFNSTTGLNGDASFNLHIPPRRKLAAITRLDQVDQLTLTPNPCQQIVHVDGESTGQMTVYDNMGRAVLDLPPFQSDGARAIDVGSLPNGQYWLKSGNSPPTPLVVNR